MTANLSPKGRAANLDRMASEPFDVLVIGGGIVGAATARDAATRGLRTALIERDDFASGTSGKTSRLVHGGLRYLSSLRLGLVRQAVRERDVLLTQAPSLVRPLPFVIPAYASRGTRKAALRVGLYAYDFLSKDKVLPRRAWLPPEGVRTREPRLQMSGLQAGAVYYDALTDDARLVLAVIRAAAEAGAAVANHAEAIAVLQDRGRASRVRVRDRIVDRIFDARSRTIVNATGVWVDSLRTTTDRRTLRPTKGIHILVRRDRIGNRDAVIVTAKRDGRVLFVLPWGDLALIGTTDTDYAGSLDRVLPDAHDVAYLLESVNETFPDAHLAPEDVVSSYAGLRPLVRGRASPDAESDISRRHAIFEDSDGLLSIVGGKLTTQRAMAEEVVDRLCARLGRRVPCVTANLIFGPPAGADNAFRAMGFDDASAARLATRYDPEDVRPWAAEPGARGRILADRPVMWLEISIAVRTEMALTLEDVLVRRLGLFYEAPDQGLGVAPAVAARMARHLEWDAERIHREVEAYTRLVADSRRWSHEA